MKKGFFLLVSISIWFIHCNKNPTIDNTIMLDGNQIYDPSLYEPEKYLLSAALPNPTAQDLEVPVILACHGYSSSTFEWDEFRDWSGEEKDFFLSQVLLGGHGRDYETFKNSGWQDWQRSIINEYNSLTNLGYQNINFLASSTSCPLILDLLSSGFFDGKTIPRHILFVDPIIIPSDKLLSIVRIVGPMLGYVETDVTGEEQGHWYVFRPQETLQELQKLFTHVRKKLESDIHLPAKCRLKTYKSKKDPSADPVSAVLIYKGVKTASGDKIQVQMVDSDLHVFTRLAGREHVTNNDRQNQVNAFQDITNLVMANK